MEKLSRQVRDFIRKSKLILSASLIALAALNSGGFCICEFRYVSDEEKVEAVLERIVGRKSVRLDPSLPPVKIHPYRSVAQILSENPGCCFVDPKPSPSMAYSLPEASPLERIFFGLNVDRVSIRIRFDPLEESNQALENYHSEYSASTTNCGKFWHYN